ncbi:NAD(P)-binding protein [Delitschia confertaspora ATCC 74209]|uniref:NAD(P)-binding protein n=1 Tax=Delitschia confertaspora ATCC 74209 TaxID=1513339 RepID=A0A9P4JS81_9PLEO|nr:NAD(P)-binding protein [Delitschia confertaspora ATCC 74209]
MSPIQKVGIFGASGTLGTPITASLIASNFALTIITRPESSSSFPAAIPVIRTEYTVEALTTTFIDHKIEAVVSAVGVAGISIQEVIIEAAALAGVKRFILSDFGYGPGHQGLEEFEEIGRPRREVLKWADMMAGDVEGFTWTAVAIGVPVDWALKKFPTLGFNIQDRKATIYDSGTEAFTGTTLRGIAAAVVGILNHPDETANKYLRVRSIQTCQNELLAAFEEATGENWEVEYEKSSDLMARGRQKLKNGDGAWVLDLIVAQLLEEGAGRSVVVTAEEADNGILGMGEESVHSMVDAIVRNI